MKKEESVLNHVLVELFNELLSAEENCLLNSKYKNITLKEIHVIEAVCKAEESGTDNSATSIAKALKITPGSLTTSVSILEKKGCLERKRDKTDRRIVRIYPTEKGRDANLIHKDFHCDMVEDTIKNLTKDDKKVLVKALESVKAFFGKKYK